MGITRYTIDYKGLPFPDPDGEYVLYEEVKEFIEGAKNTEQQLQPENGPIKCADKSCAGWDNGICARPGKCHRVAVSG